MAWKFSKRSLDNLAHAHPALKKIAMRALELTPYDFTVIETIRSVEQQRKNVAKGVSKTMKSYHLPNKYGVAQALDFAVWRPADATHKSAITWEEKYYYPVAEAFKQAAKELGYKLESGADWGWDHGHVQLMPRDLPLDA